MERKLEWYDRTTATQVTGELLPPDEPVRVTTAATYEVKMSVPAHTSITLLPTMLGNNVNCAIDVQLDERKDAKPDGDIQLDPAVYDNFAATNLSADEITVDGTTYAPTTITISGTDYTILAAQTEATL